MKKKRKYIFKPIKLLKNIIKLMCFIIILYMIDILILGFFGIDIIL